MDKTEVRTPRTAPISCPFASVVEGTAKKWRNNSYVPSIKCTSMWSPISFSESDVIRSGYEFGDRSHVTDDSGLRTRPEHLSESKLQAPLLAKRASKPTFGPPGILLKGAEQSPNHQPSRRQRTTGPAKIWFHWNLWHAAIETIGGHRCSGPKRAPEPRRRVGTKRPSKASYSPHF